MINRVVDLIVKDIRIQCASYRVCSNKCPYALFCEEYYSDELISKYRSTIEGTNEVIGFILRYSGHANKYIEKIIKED